MLQHHASIQSKACEQDSKKCHIMSSWKKQCPDKQSIDRHFAANHCISRSWESMRTVRAGELQAGPGLGAILMILFQPVSLLFQLFQNSVGACAECGAVRLQEELVSVSRRIEESWANSEQGYWLLGREPLGHWQVWKNILISPAEVWKPISLCLSCEAKQRRVKRKAWRNWANGWRPAMACFGSLSAGTADNSVG